MLLNKILELAKEGYSVYIEPAIFEDGIRIVLCTHDLQTYARQNKIIPWYILEKLDENEIVHILEEIKSNIERTLKEHDQT